MGLNPMVYIFVSAVCAGIAVFTAFFAIRSERVDEATVSPEKSNKSDVVVLGYANALADLKKDLAAKIYETSMELHRTGQRTREVTSIQDYVRLKGNEENGQSAEAFREARLG
ncbi:MAG: hypothetical protein ABR607_02675 [Pyrinomonadaceae bacterium]